MLDGRMRVRSDKGSTFLSVVPNSEPQAARVKNIAIQGAPRRDPWAENRQHSAVDASKGRFADP
jgi:hypothetical protein